MKFLIRPDDDDNNEVKKCWSYHCGVVCYEQSVCLPLASDYCGEDVNSDIKPEKIIKKHRITKGCRPGLMGYFPMWGDLYERI